MAGWKWPFHGSNHSATRLKLSIDSVIQPVWCWNKKSHLIPWVKGSTTEFCAVGKMVLNSYAEFNRDMHCAVFICNVCILFVYALTEGRKNKAPWHKQVKGKHYSTIFAHNLTAGTYIIIGKSFTRMERLHSDLFGHLQSESSGITAIQYRRKNNFYSSTSIYKNYIVLLKYF